MKYCKSFHPDPVHIALSLRVSVQDQMYGRVSLKQYVINNSEGFNVQRWIISLRHTANMQMHRRVVIVLISL